MIRHWQIVAAPAQILANSIDIEWSVINRAMAVLKAHQPEETDISWRYITRDDASWLIGADAFSIPSNRSIVYAYAGVDAIAQAQGRI
jgi:hypothetical protein